MRLPERMVRLGRGDRADGLLEEVGQIAAEHAPR
jgi:hypothetical protein